MEHRVIWSDNLAPQRLVDSPLALPAHKKIRQFADHHSRVSWLPLSFPSSFEELKRVHAESYVADCFAGKGPYEIPIAAQARYAVGAFVQGTDYAMRNKAIVCAPVSGFHHAGHDYGGGFCTFNGLMVAAHYFYSRVSRSNRLLILDCDAHFGDGTQDILEKLPFFKDKPITHMTNGMLYVNSGPSGATEFHTKKSSAERFFELLEDQCRYIRQGDYSMIFYQAGMDAWVDDCLGAGYLTAQELAKRDRMVFDACVASKTPCVWNFAGGYNGSITVTLHAETLHQALQAVGEQSGSIGQVGQGRPGVAQDQDPAAEAPGDA